MASGRSWTGKSWGRGPRVEGRPNYLSAACSHAEALALDLLKSGKRVHTFSDRLGPLVAAAAPRLRHDHTCQDQGGARENPASGSRLSDPRMGYTWESDAFTLTE
jgi:hypothetical protein